MIKINVSRIKKQVTGMYRVVGQKGVRYATWHEAFVALAYAARKGGK